VNTVVILTLQTRWF